MSLACCRLAGSSQDASRPRLAGGLSSSSIATRLFLPLAITGVSAAISLYPSQAGAAPTVFNLIGSPTTNNAISPSTSTSPDSNTYTLTTGTGAQFSNVITQGLVSSADISQAFADFSPDFTTNNNLFGGSGITVFTLTSNPVSLSGGPIGTLLTFTPISFTGVGTSGGASGRFSDITNWSFVTNTGYTGTLDFSFLSQGQGSSTFSWTAQGEIFAPGDSVPGPLPILGAASAFTMSRRIRKRIKSI